MAGAPPAFEAEEEAAFWPRLPSFPVPIFTFEVELELELDELEDEDCLSFLSFSPSLSAPPPPFGEGCRDLDLETAAALASLRPRTEEGLAVGSRPLPPFFPPMRGEGGVKEESVRARASVGGGAERVCASAPSVPIAKTTTSPAFS